MREEERGEGRRGEREGGSDLKKKRKRKKSEGEHTKLLK